MTNPSIPQDDILTVGAPAAQPQQTKGNPNVWKPRGVTAKHPEYNALVRMLPQGLAGLKANTYPSLMVKVHYLKDAATGVSKTVLCRETIGQRCPICQNIAMRYKEWLPVLGKDATVKRCRDLWSSTEWYTNVLIRQDQEHPEFNGEVKMWQHTDYVNNMLDAPSKQKPVAAVPQAPAANDIFAKRKAAEEAKVEFFIPYSPRNGRDFFVTPSWNTETNRVSYDTCSWAENPSPLAATDDEMFAILDRCHDLTQLIADMPSQEMATAAITAFWNEVNDAQSGIPQAGTGPTYAGGGAQGFYQQTQQFQQRQNVNSVDAAGYFGEAVAQSAAPAAPAYTAPAAPAQAAPAFVNDPLGTPGDQVAYAQQPAAPATQAFAAPAAPAPAAPAAPAAPQPFANNLPPSEDDDDELPF